MQEIAEMETQLEAKKLARFGVSNQNTYAAISEHSFAEFMTDITGKRHLCLGSNTEGYDVLGEDGWTYEVKHTRTTANSYVFGGLKTKSARWAVFIKWDYESTMQLEYCYVVDMSTVQSNLSPSCGRLFSKRLMEMKYHRNFKDMTEDFKEWLAK